MIKAQAERVRRDGEQRIEPRRKEWIERHVEGLV